MNIIEAIKSGKAFKRRSSKNWTSWPDQKFDGSLLLANLSADDISANDWEVESEPVTITREEFDAAWDNAMVGTRLDRDQLAKELGL